MSALLPPFRRAAAPASGSAATADRRRSFRRGVGAVLVVGLLVGLAENLSLLVVESGYKTAMPFVMLLLVLFVRPHGLFGRKS